MLCGQWSPRGPGKQFQRPRTLVRDPPCLKHTPPLSEASSDPVEGNELEAAGSLGGVSFSNLPGSGLGGYCAPQGSVRSPQEPPTASGDLLERCSTSSDEVTSGAVVVKAGSTRTTTASKDAQVLSAGHIRDAQHFQCPCSHGPGGESCMRHFSFGEVSAEFTPHVRPRTHPQIHTHRKWLARMSLQERADFRYQAVLHGADPTGKRKSTPRVGEHAICLKAFGKLFGINERTLYRTSVRVHKGKGAALLGRPRGPVMDGPRFDRRTQAEAWVLNWFEEVAEREPTGRQYNFVMDPYLAAEVHLVYQEDMSKSVLCAGASQTLQDVTVSIRVFRDILRVTEKDLKVRVRRKARTSTKCPGKWLGALQTLSKSPRLSGLDMMCPLTSRTECRELRNAMERGGLTLEERRELKQAKAEHKKVCRDLRLQYIMESHRALRDVSFQTLAFDGTDSATCRVPYEWAVAVRNEWPKNSVVQQKVQTVLAHGQFLHFYVLQPYVKLGADATTSTLVHALGCLAPEVRVVRFQFDGENTHRRASLLNTVSGGSENLNSTVLTLFGLLVEYGRFDLVQACRMPVG